MKKSLKQTNTDLDRFLYKEDFLRVRRPTDASQGLLFANGEVVFHILYCFIALGVYMNEDKPIKHIPGKPWDATQCKKA